MSLLSPDDVHAISAINKWYRCAVECGRDALRAAIECGKLLQAAKDDCDHGEWLPWLQANFDGTQRTAQRFMRLSANATALSHLDHGETLTDALASIAHRKRSLKLPNRRSPQR